MVASKGDSAGRKPMDRHSVITMIQIAYKVSKEIKVSETSYQKYTTIIN
jgi:hypothetical protein